MSTQEDRVVLPEVPQKVQPGLQDVQGNILSNYKAGHATYLFYRVDLAGPARQWLKNLLSKITTEEKARGGTLEATLNVAVTYQGLNALGVSPTSLNSFPAEFKLGMKKRASILCDFGESAPENWDSPLGSPQVHVLVLVHGVDRGACNEQAKEVKTQGDQTGGVTLLSEQQADGLKDHREHFGFRDGISQPWIEDTDPGPPIAPRGGKRIIKDGQPAWAPLNLGEFLLGYKDELNRISPMPSPAPLGSNGTYLVVRKLRQNVAMFWDEIEKRAAHVFGDKAAKERLAALMVGRWKSGCPVEKSWDRDNPGIAEDKNEVNKFDYDADQSGEQCPVGAHIRRTNPRDLKQDKDGNLVVEPVSTRHRMIRRGLPYGPEFEKNPEKERGLMFVALVADIARQFEFVQQNWVNDGDPFRLDRTDRDPLLGNNRDARDIPPSNPHLPSQPHEETQRKFTVPAATKIPWALNLSEFVATRGGDYFFVPSLTALQGLAGLGFSSFLKEYNGLEVTIPDPAKRAIAQTKLITAWLWYRPKEMLDELLEQAQQQNKMFGMPGYGVFSNPPNSYSIRPIIIATRYEDVVEILDSGKHPEMTVTLYGAKMGKPRGPFILGMELGDPRYKVELPVLAKAVQNSPVTRQVPSILDEILAPIFNRIKGTGTLDVVQDLAWPVLLGLNDKYFGVPGPDPVTFKRWLRDIYKDLFLNLQNNPEWTKAADAAVLEMNSYLDGLVQQMATSPAQFKASVLRELIQVNTTGLEPNFVRRNMMGLTVATVETTLKAIARTIDQLIRRPNELKSAQAAARAGDEQKVLQYALEAMRFNPQNHVLFRSCAKDTVIVRTNSDGTTIKTLIKQGTLVFASTLAAMFDGAKIQEPEQFLPGRPDDNYLFFGHDGHQCMGRYLVPLVLQGVLMRVLKLKNLRRAHNDPFDPLDLLPTQFLLEFDSSEARYAYDDAFRRRLSRDGHGASAGVGNSCSGLGRGLSRAGPGRRRFWTRHGLCRAGG
jgi:Dyp-type peroxidase family